MRESGRGPSFLCTAFWLSLVVWCVSGGTRFPFAWEATPSARKPGHGQGLSVALAGGPGPGCRGFAEGPAGFWEMNGGEDSHPPSFLSVAERQRFVLCSVCREELQSTTRAERLDQKTGVPLLVEMIQKDPEESEHHDRPVDHRQSRTDSLDYPALTLKWTC